MEENSRVPPGRCRLTDPPTVLDYETQGGFFRSIELCNGAGRVPQDAGRCDVPELPRATKDEQDDRPRARERLRLALTEEQPKGRHSRRSLSGGSLDVMDLCLSCKACKSECPSNVDVAKLKAEFLRAFYARRGSAGPPC